jgi:hypothetical protein
VRRAELHNDGENRGRLRVHDLRGTFVTLALASGRSEAWVQHRTGYTTSAMLNRYRRASRSAKELGLGQLRPLDQALPELRLPADYPDDKFRPETQLPNQHQNKHKAEVAEWQTRRTQNPLRLLS